MTRKPTKETPFTRQGIGEPSSRRREAAKGGMRLHGPGPWSGEGMALPLEGKGSYSAVRAGASPTEEPSRGGICD